VRDVRDVQSRLDLMDALLARAASWTVSRSVLSTALRQHILEITKIRMKTGYSPALQSADVRLTRAVVQYQFAGDREALTVLRQRLREYHEAALATDFVHTPLPRLTELAFLPPHPATSLGTVAG
jgi:hypothetical protein